MVVRFGWSGKVGDSSPSLNIASQMINLAPLSFFPEVTPTVITQFDFSQH